MARLNLIQRIRAIPRYYNLTSAQINNLTGKLDITGGALVAQMMVWFPELSWNSLFMLTLAALFCVMIWTISLIWKGLE